MGVTLQWANLYGYVRCKVGGGTNLRTMATNYLGLQLFKQVTRAFIVLSSNSYLTKLYCIDINADMI